MPLLHFLLCSSCLHQKRMGYAWDPQDTRDQCWRPIPYETFGNEQRGELSTRYRSGGGYSSIPSQFQDDFVGFIDGWDWLQSHGLPWIRQIDNDPIEFNLLPYDLYNGITISY